MQIMANAVRRAFDYDALMNQLKKAHMRLINHPETCLYAGVIMMGESTIVDDCPTAYTDGFNKRYGAAFLVTLSDPETAGLVLHENLHVILKHLPRHTDLWKADPRLANAAADYVANAVIMAITDKNLCRLPKGGLYDERFINWSVREVYDYLKTGQPKNQSGGGEEDNPLPSGKPERNKGSSGEESVSIGDETFDLSGMDEHDFDSVEQMDDESLKKLSDDINEAIHEGGMLAGRLGVKLPRNISELVEGAVNWKEELSRFVTNYVRGADELTWRRFNRRRLADDDYMPTTISETVGEIIVPIDTSGSIGGDDLALFAGELASICEVCQPERVRILWWDTKVHAEQIFSGNYADIRKLLKPVGGGGTEVTCVSKYINNKNLNADCVVMFTDGYVGSTSDWSLNIPTLWLVTGNRSFTPPADGKAVKFDI